MPSFDPAHTPRETHLLSIPEYAPQSVLPQCTFHRYMPWEVPAGAMRTGKVQRIARKPFGRTSKKRLGGQAHEEFERLRKLTRKRKRL